MSTHRGKQIRISKTNKAIIEGLRDDFGLDSQDEVITLLLDQPVNKRKNHNNDLLFEI